MFCENCGAENRDNDNFCKACGEPLNPINNNEEVVVSNSNSNTRYESTVISPPQKNMAIALILGFFITRIGLIYAGLIKRGLVFLILAILCFLMPPFSLIIWIVQIFDTYYAVKQINAGETPLFLGSYEFLQE